VVGSESALLDLVERPEMVTAAISRLVDAYLCELDQWDALSLLTRNDDNTRIGSGGFGYTSGLPSKNYDSSHVHLKICGMRDGTDFLFGVTQNALGICAET